MSCSIMTWRSFGVCIPVQRFVTHHCRQKRILSFRRLLHCLTISILRWNPMKCRWKKEDNYMLHPSNDGKDVKKPVKTKMLVVSDMLKFSQTIVLICRGCIQINRPCTINQECQSEKCNIGTCKNLEDLSASDLLRISLKNNIAFVELMGKAYGARQIWWWFDLDLRKCVLSM